MIKFFRRIRQSQIMKGQTSKYFKYAIGEIVLVVIGILIALQVNNWNIKRIQNEKESVFINQIHEEFKLNRLQFDEVTNYHLRGFKGTSYITSKMPIDITTINKDSLSFYIEETILSWTFDPQQTSINSLTNSASFDIISNLELKAELQQWNEILKDYREEELNARDHCNDDYLSYLRKKITLKGFLTNESLLDHKRITYDFLKDLEFENLIYEREIRIKDILNESDIVSDAIDRIIELTSTK